MGRLSTHVLDTTIGKPAAAVTIELRRLISQDDTWATVKQIATNSDGRTDQPLMAGEDFQPGTYMLMFHIGEYFKKIGTVKSDRPFLDIVPIRFTIADADGQYHVPLVVTPWSYSTYRGS